MSKTKIQTISIRLNPEKIDDKKIIDFLDNPYISKTKFAKTAILHEISNISQPQKTILSVNSSNAVTDNEEVAPTFEKKEKESLNSGFKAFSDKDF